ncbi:hypothetical protein BDV97DRAFT_180012 [Delphinella strobiligena]|nr:hypothetical protein BDV97DRAFT_180012 [Delphinella strobiligena]
MAASPQYMDIRSPAAFPIRLGRSAQRPSSSSGYAGVQYNHKPTLSNPGASTTSIKPPESGSKLYSLILKDGEEEYIYKGTHGVGEHTYILLPDEEGDGYVLEKLDSTYRFNLSKAPWESGSRVIAQQYPQISAAHDDDDDEEEEEGELFGDNAEDDLDLNAEADADNPFDFRHYMQSTESPSPQFQPARGSVIGTPSSLASHVSTRTSTPAARSSARKPPSAFALQERKARAKAKPKPEPAKRQQPDSKRVRLSPEAEAGQKDLDIPKVRLDRRASTRTAVPPKKADPPKPAPSDADELSLDFDGDDDDGGELVLEGDAPTSSYRGQHSLAPALSGAFTGGNGPRSLMSAASSPASHNPSPYQRHVDTDGEDIEIDMNPDSPEEVRDEQARYRGHVDEDAESDVDAQGELELDADGEADEDVDEMHLPSPAQAHRPSVSNTVVTADDDDDLENQMLLALEAEDDDMPDSDEESEEE